MSRPSARCGRALPFLMLTRSSPRRCSNSGCRAGVQCRGPYPGPLAPEVAFVSRPCPSLRPACGSLPNPSELGNPPVFEAAGESSPIIGGTRPRPTGSRPHHDLGATWQTCSRHSADSFRLRLNAQMVASSTSALSASFTGPPKLFQALGGANGVVCSYYIANHPRFRDGDRAVCLG